MYSKPLAIKAVRWSIFFALMYVSLQAAIWLGVEKKSFFVRAWDLVGGGSIGAAAGLAFFLVFGAIGWVSGAIYGSLGLLSLMFAGSLGGLGLGALIHIARNPGHYEFDWLIFLGVLVVGFFIARAASDFAAGYASQRISPDKPPGSI